MSAERKHTPGPWNIDGRYILSSEQDIGDGQTGQLHIAVCAVDWSSNGSPEQQANARLIAAAPELLAALKALIPEGWAADDTMDHMPGIKQARAAIAKATA